MPNKPPLRIPAKLAFTAISVTVAGAVVSAVACTSSVEQPTTDGGCPTEPIYCVQAIPDASCPEYVCNYEDCSIDAGCAPIA